MKVENEDRLSKLTKLKCKDQKHSSKASPQKRGKKLQYKTKLTETAQDNRIILPPSQICILQMKIHEDSQVCFHTIKCLF